MQPLDDEQDADTVDTVLLMVHKRIRKNEGYKLDSVEVFKALEQNGYPLTESEVLDSLTQLKDSKLIRAYDDSTDVDPSTGRHIPKKVMRYWHIEITPEGAMRASSVMNRYRNG
jgi:hypothetical protein